MAIQSFVGSQKNLKVNALFNWKPMQFYKEWIFMIVLEDKRYVFDSFWLMFARIRLCLHALARRGRRSRPSPTAVLPVVVLPFGVGA